MAVVNKEIKNPNSGTDGYGVMKTADISKEVQREATWKSSMRIIGAINVGKGDQAIKASDKINPQGANLNVVIQAGQLPAPERDQSKAPLQPGSLPANLPPTVSPVQAVTDSKGNYIPPELQKPKT